MTGTITATRLAQDSNYISPLDRGTIILLTVAGVMILGLMVLAAIAWLYFPVWRARKASERFWRERTQDDRAREAEMAAYDASDNLPVRVMRYYLTADEMCWEQERLEARGYQLAHQPFTNDDGWIVVTYRR